MEPIDICNIKATNKVKNIIKDQQQRIWNLERALDDLNRAAEIAQYSGQFSAIDPYRAEAEALLKDRIVLPDMDTSADPSKIRIYTGEVTEETRKAFNDKLNDQITQKALVAAGD